MLTIVQGLPLCFDETMSRAKQMKARDDRVHVQTLETFETIADTITKAG